MFFIVFIVFWEKRKRPFEVFFVEIFTVKMEIQSFEEVKMQLELNLIADNIVLPLLNFKLLLYRKKSTFLVHHKNDLFYLTKMTSNDY